MAYDVIKTYGIEIIAMTDKASDEIKKLEQELDKLSQDGKLTDGLRAQISKVTHSLNGLKGSVKSSVQDINKNLTSINDSLGTINTEKMSKEFGEMKTEITSSINSVKEDIEGLKKFLNDPKAGKGFAAGIGKQFDELKDTVLGTVQSLGLVSQTLDKILSGQKDFSSLEALEKSMENAGKNVRSQSTKLRKDLGDALQDLNVLLNKNKNLKIGNIMNDDVEHDLADIKRLQGELKRVLEIQNKIKSPTAVSSVYGKAGINLTQIKALYDEVNRYLEGINSGDKFNTKRNIHITAELDVSNKEKLVDQINIITDTIQKEVKPVKIPIGYTIDRKAVISNAKSIEQAERDISNKPIDENLIHAINVSVDANVSNLVNDVNSKIAKVNDELSKSGKKIEVDVIGKVNNGNISQAAKDLKTAFENDQNISIQGANISGGTYTFDSASGIATEDTLSSIKDILSQWNSAGLPGTQKIVKNNTVDSSSLVDAQADAFDLLFRKRWRSNTPTKAKSDEARTTDMLYARYSLKDDYSIALNEARKSLRKQNLEEFHKTKLYNAKFEYDGVEYSLYDSSKTLVEWQKIWDDAFNYPQERINETRSKIEELRKKKKSENELGKNDKDLDREIRELGNELTRQLNSSMFGGKGSDGENVKGFLDLQKQAADRAKRSLRESLKTNELYLSRDENGRYTKNIIDEKGVVTSNEDAYFKTSVVVDRIVEETKEAFNYEMDKKNELVEQRNLMQEIVALEDRQSNGSLSPEEMKILANKRQELEEKSRDFRLNQEGLKKLQELDNREQYLKDKRINNKLTKDEYIELVSQIPTQVEEVYKTNIQDLSSYIAENLASGTTEGLTKIEEKIQSIQTNAEELVKNVQKSINLVYNPITDNNAENELIKANAEGRAFKAGRKGTNRRYDYDGLSVWGGDGKKGGWRVKSNNFTTVQVKNRKQYDANQKKIAELEKENAQIEKLIVNKGTKNDYSALTRDEYDRYWSNRNHIEALKTRNKIYAEANNLASELLQTEEKIEKTTTKASVGTLHTKGKEGLEELLGARARANSKLEEEARIKSQQKGYEVKAHLLSDEDFIKQLSDEELNNAFSSLTTLVNNIENQTKLTSEQLRSLAEHRIKEDIEGFRSSILKKENEIKSIEEKIKLTHDEDAKKDLQYGIKKRQEEIQGLQNSIETLETKTSTGSTKRLDEAKESLIAAKQERDNIIEKIKQENGLTDEQLEKLQRVLKLSHNIEENKKELRNRNSLLSHATISDSGNKGTMSYSQAESIIEGNVILNEHIKEDEYEKAELLKQLTKNVNNDLLKRFGVIDKTSSEETAQMQKAKEYYENILVFHAEENNLDEEKIKNLEQIIALDEKIESKKQHSRAWSDKLNDPSFQNIPANLGNFVSKDVNNEFQYIASKKDASDEKLQELTQERNIALTNIIDSEVKSLSEALSNQKNNLLRYIEANKNDATKSNLVEVAKNKIAQIDSFIDKDIREYVERKIQNQIIGLKGVMDDANNNASYGDSTVSSPELMKFAEVFANYDDALSNYRNEQARKLGITLDEWVSFIETETKKAAKNKKKKFSPEQYVKDHSPNVYNARLKVYEDKFAYGDDASKDTAMKWHKYLQKEVELRQKAREEAEKTAEIDRKTFDKHHAQRKNKNISSYNESELDISEQKKHISNSISAKKRKATTQIKAEATNIQQLEQTEEQLNNQVLEARKGFAYEYVALLEEEKASIEKISEINEKISNKEKLLSSLQDDSQWEQDKKYIERKKNISDEEYSKRQEQKRQQLEKEYEEDIVKLRNQREEIYKKELEAQSVINNKKSEYISNYASENPDRLTSDSSRMDYLEKEYLNLFNKYRNLESQFGVYDEDVVRLKEDVLKARNQYITGTMDYIAGGGDYAKVSSLFEELAKVQENEANSSLKTQKTQTEELLNQAKVRKENLETSKKELDIEKEKRLQLVEQNKSEYSLFRKGMNDDQKLASYNVDQELIHIQELQEKLNSVPKDSDNFKEITKQINEAKKHLSLFREEAETTGLVLSEITGRMYLKGSGQEKAKISGLNYTGLKSNVSNANTFDYDKAKREAKALAAVQLQNYHHQSEYIEKKKEEIELNKKLQKMQHIAGMTDEQAEIAIKIKQLAGSFGKDWNKLTEKQLNYMHELYRQAEKLGLVLETNQKDPNKKYIKGLVGYKDFVANPEQYATNKYLRQMLSSSAQNSYDLNYIENYRGATESTLQNIQKILLTGVNVKVIKGFNDKGKLKYKHLNKRVNIDADKPGYITTTDTNNKKQFNVDDLLKKEKKSYKDWNKLISFAKSEEEKNKYRTQALETGYFALNKNKNVVSINGKDNKHISNKEIIATTKEYIETQKLAIKVEDLFAGKLRQTSKNLNEKTDKTTKNTNASKKNVKNSGNSFFELQAKLNKGTKEEKQKALDELLAKGYQLGQYSGGRFKGGYFAGRTDKTSVEITKAYAEANELVIKSLEELQKKEKENTAIIEQEAKKQINARQYTAKQINNYINSAKTDETKNKWRDIAKAQGFDLDDNLNVAEIIPDKTVDDTEQKVNLIVSKIQQMRERIDTLEHKRGRKSKKNVQELDTLKNTLPLVEQQLAELKGSQATVEDTATTAVQSENQQQAEIKESISLIDLEKASIDKVQEELQDVGSELDEAKVKAKELFDVLTGGDRIDKYNQLSKILGHGALREDLLLNSGAMERLKNNPSDGWINASSKEEDEALQQAKITREQLVDQLRNIGQAAIQGYSKNITGNSKHWTHFQLGKGTKGGYDENGVLYKVYASFEQITDLNDKVIQEIMELLQKVGFNGQLKTDKNADTIAKTDQLVIHGASRDDQIKAFQVLKYYSEMCKNLSFIGTGFDYKDASTKKTKSFSQLLEDASYSGNVDFVNDLIQKLEAEFLANIEKYNVDYIARSGIDIPKIPDDFVNDEKWAEDEANEAIRELEEIRKQLQQQGKLAGKEFGKAIEDGANDALGINSPSTVFQEIAHWCGEGFKVGLDKNGKVIYGSVAEWRDKLVAEFKSKQITMDDLIRFEALHNFDGRSSITKAVNEIINKQLLLPPLELAEKELRDFINSNKVAKIKEDPEELIKKYDAYISAGGTDAGFEEISKKKSSLPKFVEEYKKSLEVDSGVVDKQAKESKDQLNAAAKRVLEIDPQKYLDAYNNASTSEERQNVLRQLEGKIKVGSNSILNNSPAAKGYEVVLPKLKEVYNTIIEHIEKCKNASIEYKDQFETDTEFVIDLLKQQGIELGKVYNVQQDLNDENSYSFVSEMGRASVKLNKEGVWQVSGTKKIDTTLDQVRKIKKEISSLQGYEIDLLSMSDPAMFGEFGTKIKSAVSDLKLLQDILDNGYNGEDLDVLAQKIENVRSVAKELKGNLQVGESEVIGTIDKSRLGQVRQQLESLAYATSKGSVEIGKMSKNNTELTYTVRTADNMLQTYTITMNKYNGQLTKTLVSEEKYLSGFQKALKGIGAKFQEIFRYTVASVSIYEVFNFFKQGISVVQEMDTAMTNLRKVSNDTEQALQSFRKESYKIANTVGSTGKEIVHSAADWVRLGYSIKEASELAKNTAIYSNVGDMEIDVATEHMISSIKAWESEFDNEVEASEAIVDRYNEIGNNFAISSADIGEAMERSAAALKAGGNTLNESLGILVAGNVVQQDAETTAAALKILSLRIRGSKAELEEMGESTDDLVSSTSKMREEIKALSGVDIMLDENTYKSTAQIIKEVGEVYNSMSDVSQAALLEKMAGKNRASTVEGLLQNYELIDKVIKSAEQATGSASKENQKYMESIQGHLDVLTNKWQEMWDSAINAKFVNFFIDFGSSVLDLVNDVGLLKSSIIALGAGFGIKQTIDKNGRHKWCALFLCL